jgi:hypothetical protein
VAVVVFVSEAVRKMIADVAMSVERARRIRGLLMEIVPM